MYTLFLTILVENRWLVTSIDKKLIVYDIYRPEKEVQSIDIKVDAYCALQYQSSLFVGCKNGFLLRLNLNPDLTGAPLLPDFVKLNAQENILVLKRVGNLIFIG
jgi:hypothetical protein